ncbi:MAG: disulfide bond formation protein B [Roseovarius sp.]
MKLSQKHLIILAAGGSAALMLGALGFQHLGGMAPCKLCIWQRWPHVIAIALGAAALLALPRLFSLGGLLAALTTAGIGGYHTGVERGWWQGPATCSSSGTGGLSADALFEQIMSAPLVRCDEVPWEMLGLSMASWNMLASLGLAALWLMALRARQT